jgi:crossover junction endodeoxyribonuclease RuvC
MKVIGVDPGYERVGVAVIERVAGKEQVLFSICIETHATETLPARLKLVGARFLEIVEEHKPDALAIETLFFNKNQKTGMGVAQARGVLIYIAFTRNLLVYEFSPQQVKVAVTGYGMSDKTAVTSMLPKIASNVPKEALDDEYDAIAIGITCLAHHRESA